MEQSERSPEQNMKKDAPADPVEDEEMDSSEDSDFAESFPEEIVESFTGERHLPHGRKTSKSYWLQVGKVLLRLVFPRSRQMGFQVGFWVIRAFGALVLFSWLYFGIVARTWDATKFKAGCIVLLAGPLVLRTIEFLLEHLLLRGSSRRSWRDFWNFRRMMTPRTIMTAFFVGFWILVIAGALEVISGFTILVRDQELGQSTIEGMWDEFGQEMSQAAGAIPKIGTPESALRTDVLNPREETPPLTVEDNVTTESIEDMVSEMGDRIYGALLTAVFRRLPTEVSPQGLATGKSSRRHWFSRILRGLIMMTLGPLALRFACESIILFFRINETLTDIHRQVEATGRRKVRK
ncbi:MAG: hypothetical protein ACOC2L_03735 [Candidatus Sumerlaeota bacterium]